MRAERSMRNLASAEVVKIRSIRFDFQTSPILATGSLANSTRFDIGQNEFIQGPFSDDSNNESRALNSYQNVRFCNNSTKKPSPFLWRGFRNC